MMAPSPRWARCAGFLIGLGLVAVLVAGWRVAGGEASPGAHVTVTVVRTGELDVAPLGRLLKIRELAPGDVRRTGFRLTNLTGTRLAVRLRARSPSSDLDDQLAVRMLVGRRSLFTGTLGRLRAGTQRGFALAGGAHAQLSLRISIVPSRARAYRARSADVALDLLSEAAK
jgi:hypothetical protein